VLLRGHAVGCAGQAVSTSGQIVGRLVSGHTVGVAGQSVLACGHNVFTTAHNVAVPLPSAHRVRAV